ncbi:MAG: DUF2141 domain-containing protein [Desulfobacterales bacterium]|uniref:DUF2141 domain-containing protein n=1 Tax=Candidatus Desulfatibia vada TaxID=2841696 RepID=A0A8J6NRR7_9BACT|nr:DUF2141 domain-containing protein [Candidatus Desulfatibia vada]MBL6971632.1 DUF2141 domain-containing protein [Desulfobacterales bacterium]
MKKFRLLLIIISLTLFVSIAYAQTGTITVEISGIQGTEGQISIGLYTSEEGFPETEKSYKGINSKVTGEETVAVFQEVPAGTYAIAIFHDTNSNTKLDKNFLGIPKEGYAFSNNVFGTFGPPDFDDASFELDGNKTVKIKMGY